MAIRIDGAGGTGGVRATGPTRRGDAGGSTFSLPEEGGGAHSGVVGGPLGVGDLSGLLALQAIPPEDPREKRKRAVRRGLDLLDVLEQVRLDLLGGGVPVERLERIVALLAERAPSGDDKLDALVTDVELRARVELAKFGRFPD